MEPHRLHQPQALGRRPGEDLSEERRSRVGRQARAPTFNG